MSSSFDKLSPEAIEALTSKGSDAEQLLNSTVHAEVEPVEEYHFTMEQFKLAAISTEELSDDVVTKIFLKLGLESEEDVSEAFAIIQKYRPEVYDKVTGWFAPKTEEDEGEFLGSL